MTVGHLDQWVVNAADPSALARFWAFVLGGEAVTRPDGWAFVEGDPSVGRPRLSFQPDPAPKDGRNRIHGDVRVDDISAATEAVVARGAARVGEVVTDEQGSFQVLRDPEGNEFCVVAPTARHR
ncbi:VOC family protein [Nocardiopsis sp. NRRL B-16309]|uniref:VOC family protein n=1 Tax=Nocardiopsis sp. NRRL B-16309 TaxID=1519494 RepID=UPI0006B05C15|nr:VOC family protein [Nocardiopsis sp. NRRL B-16309]KOX13929.1 glyoxalase [Nocardiopsis sp. NRRL B-16309]